MNSSSCPRRAALVAICMVAMLALAGCGFGVKATGYVVTSLGSSEPTGVYQAKVQIGGLAEAITDVDGSFAVRGLRPGTYSATVSKAGYRTAQLTVVVDADSRVDTIVLEPLNDSRVDLTYGAVAPSSLLGVASQVAGSSVGARTYDPLTDAFRMELLISVSLTSENPEGPVQTYTSAAQFVLDVQPPTVSAQWLGTLAIPCGDRLYDNYRLVADVELSGFAGDHTMPIEKFSFEASVDFSTGAVVNVVITGSGFPFALPIV